MLSVFFETAVACGLPVQGSRGTGFWQDFWAVGFHVNGVAVFLMEGRQVGYRPEMRRNMTRLDFSSAGLSGYFCGSHIPYTPCLSAKLRNGCKGANVTLDGEAFIQCKVSVIALSICGCVELIILDPDVPLGHQSRIAWPFCGVSVSNSS